MFRGSGGGAGGGGGGVGGERKQGASDILVIHWLCIRSLTPQLDMDRRMILEGPFTDTTVFKLMFNTLGKVSSRWHINIFV